MGRCRYWSARSTEAPTRRACRRPCQAALAPGASDSVGLPDWRSSTQWPGVFTLRRQCERAPSTPSTLVLTAQLVSRGVHTLSALLLKAPCCTSKLRPNLSLPRLQPRRPVLRLERPLLAHGSASREEKRLPSVHGGKPPSSSPERETFHHNPRK